MCAVGVGVAEEGGGLGGRRVGEGGLAWAMAQKGQEGLVSDGRGIWGGEGGGVVRKVEGEREGERER